MRHFYTQTLDKFPNLIIFEEPGKKYQRKVLFSATLRIIGTGTKELTWDRPEAVIYFFMNNKHLVLTVLEAASRWSRGRQTQVWWKPTFWFIVAIFSLCPRLVEAPGPVIYHKFLMWTLTLLSAWVPGVQDSWQVCFHPLHPLSFSFQMGFPSKTDSPSCEYSRFDFDSDEDFNAFFNCKWPGISPSSLRMTSSAVSQGVWPVGFYIKEP